MPWPKGRPYTEEHKAKIRASLKIAMSTPEVRAKISAAMKGKPKSEQHRRQLVEILKNPKVIGECVYCGEPATQQDHVVPRGRLGWEDHLVPACRRCNDSKNNRTPEEWFAAGLYEGTHMVKETECL